MARRLATWKYKSEVATFMIKKKKMQEIQVFNFVLFLLGASCSCL
jgi:hypothetical protein